MLCAGTCERTDPSYQRCPQPCPRGRASVRRPRPRTAGARIRARVQYPNTSAVACRNPTVVTMSTHQSSGHMPRAWTSRRPRPRNNAWRRAGLSTTSRRTRHHGSHHTDRRANRAADRSASASMKGPATGPPSHRRRGSDYRPAGQLPSRLGNRPDNHRPSRRGIRGQIRAADQVQSRFPNHPGNRPRNGLQGGSQNCD